MKALVAGALCGLYFGLLRRRTLTWGATEAEATARLPGDELLEHADGAATRAIAIDAPAGVVWPWLVQMGPSPRGGAYTYDWIENLLGLDMHSVDRVLPEFQHPEVGETIGYGSNRMRFERIEPGHALALRSEDGNWVWTFVLEQRDGTTRLISRNRLRLPNLRARIGMLAMEPASLVMERKMLLGIKHRAEQTPASLETDEQRRRLAHVLDREERRRREVAHELQEDAAQALAGVLLGLGAMRSDRAAAEDPARLAQVRSDLEATVVALRRLATALRPAVLDQLGLRPALERLADDHGLALEFAIDQRLGEDLETVIYRVVEDAIELLDGVASVVVRADGAGTAMRIAGDRAHDPEDTCFAGIRGRLDTVDGGLEIEAGEPGTIVLLARIPALAPSPTARDADCPVLVTPHP